MTYTNGGICKSYHGDWKNNKKHGCGVMKYTDGATYDGEWRNGRKHGKGTFKTKYYKYDGEWKNSVYHGRGEYYDAKNGTTYTGDYANGERCPDGHGKIHGKMKYKDGSVYTGYWRKFGENYEKHGPGVEYSEERDVIRGCSSFTWKYEGDWINGNKHGHGTRYKFIEEFGEYIQVRALVYDVVYIDHGRRKAHCDFRGTETCDRYHFWSEIPSKR